MNIFRIVRMFDPYQMTSFSNNLSELNVPKFIHDKIKDVWSVYVNIYKNLPERNDDFNLENWCKDIREICPKTQCTIYNFFYFNFDDYCFLDVYDDDENLNDIIPLDS
ncbi:unnamed protein product [Brachionus calyciflorus]|uniref:Uncharacterized protein n=1 Tax=Brachionus calyciflorus TaxID=104777 RepID=A0A814PFM4_9BILA|nr:unnamed protein product [Brachionus calyciflorus]